MKKIVMATVVAIVIGPGLHATPSLAESALLEIDVNEKNDVLEVRDGFGKPLDQAGFQSIGGFDLILSRDLLVGEVVGNPVNCCWRGGRWYAGPCPQLSTILINDAAEVTRVDGRVGGVWQENLAPVGDGPIPSAVIRSFKSHVIALVESEGTRHGIVITSGNGDGGGQKIWFDAEVFELTGE